MGDIIVRRVWGSVPGTHYILVILVVGVAAANHHEAHLAGLDGWVDDGEPLAMMSHLWA